MVFIDNVSENEYKSFIDSFDSHFMKSYYWAHVKYADYKSHYVGIKRNNKLIATALLLEKHIIGPYCFFCCPSGFACDYNDKELLKEFTKQLSKYCKKRKGLFLRINPDIQLHTLDFDGNVVDDGFDNHALVDYLTSIGYKHKGYNKNFETDEPRYTFKLDVDADINDLRKNFHSTTRNIINRGNVYNLKIAKGSENDIELFYDTMMDTAARENLTQHSLDYYRLFYTVLNKFDMSDLYTVKVNVNNLKILYNEKIKTTSSALEKLDTKNPDKKTSGKILDLQQQLEKFEKELVEIHQLDVEELILSSMITVKFQDKVWTVHGGNKDVLRFLNANYWLYYSVIENANEEGYKIVDFYGTSGDPDPSNSIYGIHLFKKRWGGKYIEFIGEFDLVTNKLMYFAYNRLIPLYRKIRRKR